MNLSALHLIVSGRVQGVGFRYFAHEKARLLQITGFVRNLSNGAIEIFAEGDDETLVNFYSLIKQGPPSSRITDAKAEWEKEPARKYKDFSITF